jgi:hypothetical protein
MVFEVPYNQAVSGRYRPTRHVRVNTPFPLDRYMDRLLPLFPQKLAAGAK